MSRERVVAGLLVAVQAAGLAFTSGAVAFPAAVVGSVVAAERLGKRFTLVRQSRMQLYLLFALLFAAKYAVFPSRFPIDVRFAGTEVAYVIAQYFLVLQVIQFYCRQPDDHLPLALPWWAAVVMICTFDVNLPSSRERIVHQSLAVGFALLCALYVGAHRRPSADFAKRFSLSRLLAGISAVVLFGSIAWGASQALFRYERDIEALLNEILEPTDATGLIGFSEKSRLGSVAYIKTSDEDAIALRISADVEPGYMRGKAFDVLDASQWHAAAASYTVFRLPRPPAELAALAAGESVFATAESAASRWKPMTVWPNGQLSGRIFAPLATSHVAAAVSELVVDQHNIVQADSLPAGHSYSVFVSAMPDFQRPSKHERQRLTALSSGVSPQIEGLAAEIFAGCATNREKIAAVVRHLRTNYRYSIDVRVPGDVDPLTWFLLRRPAAHCEFFASGAALLLRLGGVPCRYVTGFVATERNRYGGYWVARNKDAHAWVEAYDDSSGWLTVEATPAAGVPAPSNPAEALQIWEFLRDRVDRLRIAIQRGGLQRASLWVVGALATVPGLTLLATALLVVAGFLWTRRRKHGRRRASPLHAEMHRLLARMDARLGRWQLHRRESETLSHFAERVGRVGRDDRALMQAADWYRRYAALRYRKDVDFEDLARLAELQ